MFAPGQLSVNNGAGYATTIPQVAEVMATCCEGGHVISGGVFAAMEIVAGNDSASYAIHISSPEEFGAVNITPKRRPMAGVWSMVPKSNVSAIQVAGTACQMARCMFAVAITVRSDPSAMRSTR